MKKVLLAVLLMVTSLGANAEFKYAQRCDISAREIIIMFGIPEAVKKGCKSGIPNKDCTITMFEYTTIEARTIPIYDNCIVTIVPKLNPN